jgi:N12 class adenine-specific DNA methylase
VSDLPPGFELESDGLPAGFEIEAPDVSEQIVRQATGLAAVAGPAAEPSYAQVVPRALEGFGRNAYGAGGATAQAVGEIPTPVLSPDMQHDTSGGSGTFDDGTQPAMPGEQGGGAIGVAGGGSVGSGVPAPAYDTGRRVPLAPGLAAAGRDVAIEQRNAVQKLREGIPEGISGKGLLFDVVTNAPQIAVPLAIGAINPAAGVAVGSAMAGGISFGNRYDELRNVRQMPVGDAWQGAAVSGAAEVLTEKLALDAIIKTGKAAGLLPALKRIAVAAGAEGAQESLVQAIEEGYNAGVLGDETTLGEALSKIGYAGLVGAIIGGGAKGVAEIARAAAGNKQAPVPGSPPPPAPPPPAPPPAAAQPPAPAPPPAAAAPVPPAAAAPVASTMPPPAGTAPANPSALPANDVDLENFGNEPLPGDVVRQQFLAERGLIEQDDGSFVTEDGALLDPADTATLHDFLAAVDDAVVDLEDQMVPVTPDTIRRELQNRQRLRDLEAERGNARTPEAQAVIDEQIAAASEPAGGAVAELQTVADNAKERGDKQTAKAAQDAIKTLQEPNDGAVADRGGEGGRADLAGSEADAGRAGLGQADVGGAEAPAAGTAPAGETPVAVEAGAVQPAAGVEADPRRGQVGGMLAAGEVVATASGRSTTPFPKIDTSSERKTGNTLKRVDEWLMQNALDEAEARGDEFNARSFRQDLKNPPPAAKDSAEEYLFGDSQPPVLPSILKPLAKPSEAIESDPAPAQDDKPTVLKYLGEKGASHKVSVLPPRAGAKVNAATAGQWSVQTQTKAGSVTVPTQTRYFDSEQQALDFAKKQKAQHMGKAPADSNKTAPEHDAYPTEGASEADLKAIVKEFNEAHAATQSGDQVTHIFDPPAKSEVVRLNDEAKVQVNGSGWMTVEEAKAKVAEWKAHAKAQGADPKSRSANSEKVVLSLFDLSGEWSQPWVDAGYQVYRFDIQDDPENGDVTKFSVESFMDTFSAFEGQDIHAILAACPCTDFAVSGARHFAAKDADGRTVSSVKLVHQTLATIEFFKPAVWAIENPVGRIETLTGLPPWRLSFDPNHFGDPYTKKTLLWGRFDGNLPIAPVEPTEGSKMHKLYGGKSQATKNARSVTPEGFAYSFFMANNAIDNPLLAVAGKYDRLDRDAIKAALDAGVTPAQIDELVEDFYYMELDDEAANAALRDAATSPPGAPRTDEGSKAEKPVAAGVEGPESGVASVKESPVSFTSAEGSAKEPATLADQLAGMSDADLEALIDDVAHEERAAETEKPVAKRSGKTKPPKAKPSDQAALLAAYFAPGNIVPSYSGHDRVIEFEPEGGTLFRVKVQAVVRDGKGWKNEQKWPEPRWHQTVPEPRQLKAGPTESAAPWPPAAPVQQPKLRKGKAPVERAKAAADVDRTVGEIAGSLGVNLSSAGKNALTGLTKLFGTSGKVSAGLTFDEDTYKQAKPYFQQLLQDFQAAGKDIRDLVRELVKMLGTGAKPYILRFAQDLRAGNTEASNEQGDVRVEDPAQPDEVAADAGQGAESVGAVRGDGAGAGEAGAGAPAGADAAGVSGPRGRGSREQRDREPGPRARRGAGAVGAGRAGEAGSGVPSDPVTPAATNIPAANFEINDDLRLGRGGEVEKFNDNIAAIEALKRLEAENRRATPEEQKLLARYVGWGGLANAFPDPTSGEWSEKWKERGPRLRELLTKAEYTAARRSTRNAHYTSEPIVRGMWRAARRLGFRGGLALESSMGVGNFLGLKPADLPAKFIGVEYDSLTSRIAGALYPQATVLHSGFQSVPLPDKTFALSIGNPPFGSESLRFQFKPELNGLSIHNQFFLGALDAVRPGGLHIAVVSRFLMDAQDSASRLMLAERGELVAAIRLPDTAFKENARTEVVTDIIILRRHDAGEQESMKLAIQAYRQPKEKDAQAERERAALADKVPDWVQTAEIADPLGGEAMRVNRYFKSNPQNIIGVLERSGSMKQGADITVRLDDVGSLERRLNEIVDRLPANASNIGQDVLDTTEQRYALLSDALKIAVSGEEIGHVKLENDGTLSRVLEREGPDGSLLLTKQTLSAEAPFSDQLAMDESGKWYRNEVVLDDKGAPVKMLGKDGKPGKRNLYERRVFPKDSEVPLTLRLGKVGFAKLKSLAALRDLLKKQLVLETEDADSAVMEGNRKKLADAYEAFVTEHGPINRAATLSLAMTMPDGGLISALEVRYQPARSKTQAERSGLPEQNEEAKPAPILRERVVPKYEPPTSAGTAADALAIVLAERGMVDMERIAQLRGVTEDAAVAELQKGDKPLVFLDPETQAWETRDAYLSGQVRRKLAAARNAGLEQNIAALEAIQPAAWGSDDVTVKIGATWVPPAVYAKFVEHLIGGAARVDFSTATNSFAVEASDWDRSKRPEWGTQRAPAEWIISRMLNSLPTSVYDTDSDGKSHLNQEETQLAQIKSREIGNAFDEWIFNDADQRKMLVDLFNEKYNTRVSRQFDGSHLTLPGKVPDSVISMRRHQKNAIWRGISTKALLLDHVVGAGKTFTGIARVMERRRMGISRKPAIVVPNHLVEQWAADVYRLYPAAKVLAAGKSDFEAKNRRKLFGKIATGDWDVVIIPHSSFGFIGIAPETELRYLEAEMAQAQAAIEEAWEVARENGQDSGRRKPFNVKEAERLAEKIQGRMDKLREGTRDKLLTYEQLGIDDLTIDEAHEFKNLFYSSRLTGVRGMGNKSGSRKAADLYNKVRVTRDVGGAITFMTGTPVSNSAVELYTMMRYLVPEALEELGLTHFDAWRAQYVDASPAFEPTETGRLKQVTRMGRSWENMRSLMDLYYSFADAVSIDDIKSAYAEDNPGKEFPVPKVKGGDRQLVKIEPTSAQLTKLNDIIAGFDGLDGITDPYERNAARLRLMDQARKVSLDIRAVDPTSKSTEDGGKLQQVSAEVKRIYDASTDRRGTQLIFLDRSVPKSKGDDVVLKKYDELIARQEKALRDNDEAALQEVNEALEKFESAEIAELRAAQSGGWNAYQQIKDNLVALGIPAGEIRFIQEANTDEQKDALFDAVRGGKVRVLLGSTPRMGAGTNVQDRLVGLHHVDVTWKPSDIEQREGRIIRQGNLFASPEINGKPNPLYDPLFEVEIKAYATERTVDSKMWSLNATKLKTINGLRKYDGAFTMQIDDEESVSMAEMAALASGNPLLLERVQLDSEINDLELQQRAHRRKVMGREDEISSARRIVAEYPDIIKKVTANVAEVKQRADAVDERIQALTVDVEGKAYTRLPEAQKAAFDAITSQQAGDERAKYAVSVNGKRFTNKQDIADAMGEALGDAEPFEMAVGDKVYYQRSAAARAIREQVLKAVEALGDKRDDVVKLGKAFGYELVADVHKIKKGSGSWKLDFALVDGNQTILSTYGPEFLPSNKDALSIQSLRPAVGAVFSEYLKRGRAGSIEYYQASLDDAQRRLPDLEAKPVPEFAKADELTRKIARLKEVVAELSSTAETPKEQPSFNRGTDTKPREASPETVARVETMVQAITRTWAVKPKIIVVASMQDAKVPARVREADAAQKAGGATGEPLGWIMGGTIYVNAGTANTPDSVIRTVNHEALGHFGLRGMFGSRLDDELKKVALLRAKDVKAKMAEYGMDDTSANRLRAAEEVLARMAEETPQLPLVQRVLAAIRSFLRPIFEALKIKLDLTDAEIIRDFLIPARDFVRRGATGNAPSGMPSGAFRRASRVAIDRGGKATALVGQDAGRGPRRGEVIVERSDTGWRVSAKGEGIADKDVRRALLVAQGEPAAFSRVVVDRAGNVVPLIDRDRAVRAGEVVLEESGDGWNLLDRGAGVTDGMIERAKLAADDRLPVFSRGQDIYDIGFTLPNGARYARVTRDATGERYDYFDTREAAEQAGPGRAPDTASRAAGSAGVASQSAGDLRAEGRQRAALGRLEAAVAAGRIRSFDSVAQARQAGPSEGRNRRLGLCFEQSSLAANDGLGAVVIGRVNSGPQRIWHAVVRLPDGRIFDAVDRAIYKADDYAKLFEFAPIRALNPDAVSAFIAANNGLAPDPQTLGFEDTDTIDFNRGPAAPASWQSPDPSRLDDFIHALQDKNVDLRRAMQEMRKAGAAIADAQDAYTVEELSTSRKAAQIKAFVDTEVAAVLKQMNLEGLTIEEVEEYLHARHAPEANAQIASINPTDPNMQDGGSGMLTQDALDYMAALPRSKALALGRVARLVDDINEGTKQLLVVSGLEKAETIAEWDATYQHYVPLQREGFEGQSGRGTGQGISVRGTAIKSRMGSKRAVVDILANVVAQREKVITRAENNRVGQALLGLAIKNPNPAFWLPVNPDVKTTPSRSRKLKRELISMGLSPQDADGVAREPLQRHYNPLTGLVEYRVNPALRNRDNVISVRVNGKDRFIFFKEDSARAMRMAEALKNLDARDMGRMMRMLGAITRYFASINTQFNIIFGQVNFLRDVQAALLNLGDTPLAGQGMVVAKEARRLYAATFKTAFRLDKLQGADLALWQRFRDAGGPTGFRDIFPSSTARTEALRRELDPEWWTKTQWGKVLTANGALKMPEEQLRQRVSHAFRWISDYNQALENITRMAAFKTAVESGLTDQQAASLAKNLTTNFNRRGAWSQQLGAWYAFFNAGVQGTARIAKAMTKLENGKVVLSGYGKRIVAGGIGLGVIQALALAASGADDDEPPEFIRERNLLLPDFITGSGGYVSIPMPLGWHVLPNIGRKLTELALRGGERPVDTFTDLFRITLDAFNPLGSGTLAQTLSPTAADPIVALNSNRDWTGRPIAREDRNSLDPTPGFTRGRDNASVFGETIAEGLNWLTGGTDFTPGAASPTPDQVDYLAGQIGGGVAREIIKGIDSAGAVVGGEAPPLYRVPLVGRFIGSTRGESSERNRFYENELKVNVAENEARGRAGRGENIEAYLKKHPEALLKPTMDRVKRDIDKLNRERRERLAAGASAAEVRPLTTRISELQAAMNQKYREVHEAR